MSKRHPPEKADAVRTLARAGRDQRQIAQVLGVSKGFVSSVLRAPWRTPNAAPQRPSVPVSAPRPPSVPTPPPAPENGGYVADDDAIAAHVTALAELVDRRVDAAVGAELADPEALADRWANSAADAGWPVCPQCGQHVRPEGES